MSDTEPQPEQAASEEPASGESPQGMAREDAERRLVQLQGTLENAMLELRARGGRLPIGPLRMETLIALVFPEGSDGRLMFDLQFHALAIQTAEETAASLRREALRAR